MAKKWDASERPSYTVPDPTAHANYQRDLYGKFTKPIFSTKPSEWERLARSKVPLPNYLYVYGAASSGATHRANTDAFNRYRLRPRMLVDATVRDTSVTLFGQRMNSPILVAPVGVQNIMHRDAELATARACAATGTTMVVSTAATHSIEEVATVNGNGNRWYQLYWPKPQYEDVTVSLLNRARDNGYKVLVVTLDTMLLAWRPEDLDGSYLPFLWGDGCQVGFSDPVWQRIFEEEQANDTRSAGEKLREAIELLRRPGSLYGAARLLMNVKRIQKAQSWVSIMNSGTYRRWKHLEILKRHWSGPILLKGVQTKEDARKAVEYGMDGIIVSNHGGRQLDGAVASLDALAQITADEQVKQSNLTVLFDSGIRTGSDVLKALALGAKAVLIGRPFMYGLAIAGQAGVEHVLRCLKADTDNMLGNLGKTSLQELSREDLSISERAKL